MTMGRMTRGRSDRCRGSWLALVGLVGSLLWQGLSGPAASGQALAADLLPIGEVRALSAEVLAGRPEVRIRGVVTFRGKTELIVQDDTAGLGVHFPGAAASGLWKGDGPPADVRVGDDVEIEGVAFNYDIAPGFWPRSVVNHGPAALPDVIEADADRFFGGAENCRTIAFSGIVHRIRDADTHWRIILEGGSRPFSAFISKQVLAESLGRDPAELSEAALGELLVDAVVRVVGPATMRTHNHNAQFEPQVNVGRPEWFEVVSPPPQPAFAAPLVPMDMLGRQRPWEVRGHRIRITGIVIHAIPGEVVFIQQGGRGIRVETASSERFRLGDEVEAAGFIIRRGRISWLADALVRRTGTVPPPAPTVLRSPLETAFVESEGTLVRLEATLLDARPTQDGTALTLSADTSQINALLPTGVVEAIRGLESGAVVSLTGIGETAWRFDETAWPAQVPDGLRLIVRSSADVEVVRPAPWWTPGRLGSLLGFVAAALVAALTWTVTLRHRLRIQTGRLAAEMRSRRDAAVEFAATLKERNRLAANLHDTLLQTLGGIGYQLDACQASRSQDEDEARMHFDVARRMVSHATSELHGAVWAMRSLPSRERSFPDAIRAVVDRVSDGHPVETEVRTCGQLDKVPEFVAGNLLLIVQEAVHNALRHGHPRNIIVELTEQASSQSIRAEVRDDGRGFATMAGDGAVNNGVEAGHFGLLGMRERAERLGGSFQIESTVGRGTTVTVEVRHGEYDEELAEPVSVGNR
jgi:signal transduction histidine kinase